jgi:hypothetical protein
MQVNTYLFLINKWDVKIVLYTSSKDIARLSESAGWEYTYYELGFFDINYNLHIRFIKNIRYIKHQISNLSKLISGKKILFSSRCVDLGFLSLIAKLTVENDVSYVYFRNESADLDVKMRCLTFKLILVKYIGFLSFNLKVDCKLVNGEQFLCASKSFFEKYEIKQFTLADKCHNYLSDINFFDKVYDNNIMLFILGYTFESDSKYIGKYVLEDMLKWLLNTYPNIYIKVHPGSDKYRYFQTRTDLIKLIKNEIPAHIPVESIHNNVNIIISFASNALITYSNLNITSICLKDFIARSDKYIKDEYYNNLQYESNGKILFPSTNVMLFDIISETINN